MIAFEYDDARGLKPNQCDVCADRGPCNWCGRRGPETLKHLTIEDKQNEKENKSRGVSAGDTDINCQGKEGTTDNRTTAL